jgi:serine/threonine-protein kinase
VENLGTKSNEQSNIAARDPFVGSTFDERYLLEQNLGRGGMGSVYRATDLKENKSVALKVLKFDLSKDEAAEERFWQEAETASAIQHPNVRSATDLGITDDGTAYIVMELLEGETLRYALAQDAPLDVTRAIVLALQIAEGVGAAHAAGIIHRDLKPTNIFIAKTAHAPATIKVLDFGLAKLLPQDEEKEAVGFVSGRMRGTPRYMSPEQCEGGELTAASDVYSLAVILFEMLTNATPFSGANAKEIAFKQLHEDPPQIETIPKELNDFVQRSLSKEPEKRPRDANEFYMELKALAESLDLLGNLQNLSVEKLIEVGRASPSGRLVIDAETLRELQTSSDRKKKEIEPEEKSVSETNPATENEESVARERQETNAPKEKELTAEERHALRMQRIIEREKIIHNWAKQPVNFVAIILLIIFLLMIVISYILRPPAEMPLPAGGPSKGQEQKK